MRKVLGLVVAGTLWFGGVAPVLAGEETAQDAVVVSAVAVPCVVLAIAHGSAVGSVPLAVPAFVAAGLVGSRRMAAARGPEQSAAVYAAIARNAAQPDPGSVEAILR